MKITDESLYRYISTKIYPIYLKELEKYMLNGDSDIKGVSIFKGRNSGKKLLNKFKEIIYEKR